MTKNWGSAPWMVRLLFVYWLIPLIITGSAVGFVALEMSKAGTIEIWRIPIEMFRFQYNEMPISTSIDISLSIMYCSAAFYAWKMLRGSGKSRIVLEMFSWISILFGSINIFFPSLRYFELENLSPSFWDIPVAFLLLAAVLLLLQVAVLCFLRTEVVRNYANTF